MISVREAIDRSNRFVLDICESKRDEEASELYAHLMKQGADEREINAKMVALNLMWDHEIDKLLAKVHAAIVDTARDFQREH